MIPNPDQQERWRIEQVQPGPRADTRWGKFTGPPLPAGTVLVREQEVKRLREQLEAAEKDVQRNVDAAIAIEQRATREHEQVKRLRKASSKALHYLRLSDCSPRSNGIAVSNAIGVLAALEDK